jgi:hypothetical protein
MEGSIIGKILGEEQTFGIIILPEGISHPFKESSYQ